MENKWPQLSCFPKPAKWALVFYIVLLSIAFSGAAMMSYDKYQFNHEKTVVYYQGEAGEDSMNLPKPYGHLLAAFHVHAYTMPMVFMSLWMLLTMTRASHKIQVSLISISTLSVIGYNAAPWLTRYSSAKYAVLFTVGGIGMFVSFVLVASYILLDLRKK